MVNALVLVLNQSYETINICRVRRAVVLIFNGKAEMVENGSGEIKTAYTLFPMPSVIRLAYQIRRPWLQHKLTRFQVFLRDQFTCQYCSRESHNLTLDHIIPRHRGGEHVWENVVSACVPCNHHKAGRTPAEAGMRLIRPPFTPPPSGFQPSPYHLKSYPQWQKFLPQ